MSNETIHEKFGLSSSETNQFDNIINSAVKKYFNDELTKHSEIVEYLNERFFETDIAKKKNAFLILGWMHKAFENSRIKTFLYNSIKFGYVEDFEELSDLILKL